MGTYRVGAGELAGGHCSEGYLSSARGESQVLKNGGREEEDLQSSVTSSWGSGK